MSNFTSKANSARCKKSRFSAEFAGQSKAGRSKFKRDRTLTRAVYERLEPRRMLTTLYPTQVRHAYGADDITFNGINGDGTGQTIAIVIAGSDPSALSDLEYFDKTFGVPDPPSFQRFDQTGGTAYPAVSTDAEEGLDIEWSHVMAPGAAIDVVECNSFNGSDILSKGVVTAAGLPGVSVVSMSFGS